MGPVGFVDMGVHRRLCVVSLHTGLDGFFVGRKTSTAKVAGRVATGSKMNDYGYCFYYRLTRLDPLAPAYTDRASAANEIAASFAKLQLLSSLVPNVCIES